VSTTELFERLARPADGPPARPVRIVHLGLGNFFRAHQAWYTELAPDGDEWGIAAFTGRSAALADALSAQDGLYTLITRGAGGDTAQVVASLSGTGSATDTAGWLRALANPDVRILTLTVTEAGYLRDRHGDLDVARPELSADLTALRADQRAPVVTMPGKLVAGLAARHAAKAGPLAVVSCDNLPANGAVTAKVVSQLAALLDPELARWIDSDVSFVTTMVDRITPATTDADRDSAARLTGRSDAAPVVTEPYSEWVLCGSFPGGRPRWEAAGARFVDDVTPFEERKLWLLNGGHSLLAYAGSARGHTTIAAAVGDPTCREWLEQWWNEAATHLTVTPTEVGQYRQALLERFVNARIQHLLAQIAADGSQKLPIRILPAIAAERAAGRLPLGGLRVLAAWINHLRGAGAPVKDAAAQAFEPLAAGPLPAAVRAVLGRLAADLTADEAVVDAVVELCGQLSAPTVAGVDPGR
jgi:fructuronate reductase